LEQLSIFLNDFSSFINLQAVTFTPSSSCEATRKMPLPGEILGSAAHHNSVKPLPLFRPEALAAVQQKFHGEIILVRPFSLMLLGWFGVGITAAVLGFLLLGQYTERVRVPGTLTKSHAADSGASSSNLTAEFYVPVAWIGQLHRGSKLSLRCEFCSAQFAQQTGTVLEIPDAPLGQTELSHMDLNLAGPVYKIAVALPPPAAQILQLNPSPQTGMRLEAEIPLGRKPLIKWFFERSGS
jgi:hypothetical protein